MVKRTKSGQHTHDKALLSWTNKMKKQGFDVQADLPGMKKPKKIGGNIPDGLAKKGKTEKLIELETPDTLKADEKQRRPFRQWADKSANRTFFTKVVKKKK